MLSSIRIPGGAITKYLVLIIAISLGWTRATLAFGQVSDRGENPTLSQIQGEESEVSPDARSEAENESKRQNSGLKLANTDKVRFGFRFMAGYGQDLSQATLGFENQGRVGYAIIELFGKINDQFSYRLEINPVDEVEPLISCGEDTYFYPNAAQNFGPNVACDNDGRLRVDDYRFIALDLIRQQGPIRQAYLRFESGPISVKAGRLILPVGFLWEEAGSFSAKDATHIQRINAEANFGAMLSLTHRTRSRRTAGISAAVFLGGGNRFHDYNYFYGLDGSLDSNSGFTALISASAEPVKGLDLRVAHKRGQTGSKVERLPNFYASKRNDYATVLSAGYRPIRYFSVFGEYASYTWGPVDSSAILLGMDPAPVHKRGYYVGGEVSYPVTTELKVGAVVTHEEMSRDDSLVKYLAEQQLYDVTMGEKERSTVLRFYLDIAGAVRIGVYHNRLQNPFPWLSGISPVSGFWAYSDRGNNKTGIVLLFRLE
jgi:hypothetical protein